MGGPNTGPGKHGHTSVLDLSLLKELRLGEHVGESIISILKLSEGKRIPWLSSNLFKSSGGEGSGRLCNTGRCESGGRCYESGGECEGKLGHLGIIRLIGWNRCRRAMGICENCLLTYLEVSLISFFIRLSAQGEEFQWGQTRP